MTAFPLVVGLGSALGLFAILLRTPEKQVVRYLDNALLTLLGGLLVSRTFFVLAGWSYFQDRLYEAFQVWLGGLSGPGFVVGVLLTLVALAWITRQNLGKIADGMLPIAPPLAISAWLGCWLVGMAYGSTTTSWLGVPSRDEWGIYASRWPVQALGALLALAWLGLVEWLKGRLPFPGQAASLALLGLCLQLSLLSMFRADASLALGSLRLDTWGWSILAIIAAATFLAASIQYRFYKVTGK